MVEPLSALSLILSARGSFSRLIFIRISASEISESRFSIRRISPTSGTSALLTSCSDLDGAGDDFGRVGTGTCKGLGTDLSGFPMIFPADCFGFGSSLVFTTENILLRRIWRGSLLCLETGDGE